MAIIRDSEAPLVLGALLLAGFIAFNGFIERIEKQSIKETEGKKQRRGSIVRREEWAYQ